MPAPVHPQNILVVDDDHGLLRLMERALQRAGFRTGIASTGEETLQWLRTHPVDLMLLDLKLQDSEGQELVARLTEEKLCPPFLIITGQGDERIAVEMMKRGARDYLVKDVDFLQFLPTVVKRVLEEVDRERRLAEAEEQIHLVRSVIEQGFSAVLISTAELPDPKVIYINPAFSQATGYRPEDVLGKPLSSLAGLRHVYQRLQEGLPRGAAFLDEVSTFEALNGERWGEWRLGPVQDKSGRSTHWLFIFRDITDRKRLEKEILEISDKERRRLGQDLHDGLCQHLAGIELMSEVLRQKLVSRSKADANRAADIARHVREAISQTRSLARGLAPVTLESEGLASAVRELAANTEKMFGVPCRVECRGSIDNIATATATHLYRIAQEAVSNGIRHGKATQLIIRLESLAERMVLVVLDNGAGLPKVLPCQEGMGFRIMRYRAGMIGGLLAIETNVDGGTAVSCSVPLRALSLTDTRTLLDIVVTRARTQQ
jgi:PAS domain S-box-containing protein